MKEGHHKLQHSESPCVPLGGQGHALRGWILWQVALPTPRPAGFPALQQLRWGSHPPTHPAQSPHIPWGTCFLAPHFHAQGLQQQKPQHTFSTRVSPSLPQPSPCQPAQTKGTAAKASPLRPSLGLHPQPPLSSTNTWQVKQCKVEL